MLKICFKKVNSISINLIVYSVCVHIFQYLSCIYCSKLRHQQSNRVGSLPEKHNPSCLFPERRDVVFLNSQSLGRKTKKSPRSFSYFARAIPKVEQKEREGKYDEERHVDKNMEWEGGQDGKRERKAKNEIEIGKWKSQTFEFRVLNLNRNVICLFDFFLPSRRRRRLSNGLRVLFHLSAVVVFVGRRKASPNLFFSPSFA